MTTIHQALRSAYTQLAKSHIPSAALDAELLLSFVLSSRGEQKKTREYILAHQDKTLTARQAEKFSDLIKKRSKHLPLAYLTHEKEFYGRPFYVDKRVLVPRPETEIIIEEALRTICHCEENREVKRSDTTWQSRLETEVFGLMGLPRSAPLRSAPLAMTIVDIGTGSGCIITTLACELQARFANVAYIATDISSPALAVARKNAKAHGVADKIKFRHGNLLEPLLKYPISNIQYLIITANLPYLTPAQIKNSPTIKSEPRLALAAGSYGLKYYRQLATQIKKLSIQYPNIPISLVCEIGETHGQEMKKIFSFAKSLEIKKDLAGLDRIVIITFYL